MKKLIILALILLALYTCASAEGNGVYNDPCNEGYYFEYVILSSDDPLGAACAEEFGCEAAKIVRYMGRPGKEMTIEDYQTPIDVVIPGEVDGHPVVSLGESSIPVLSLPQPLACVTLPDSLRFMSESAIDPFPTLQEIILSADHPAFELVDGALYDKSTRTLLCRPASLPGETFTVQEGTLTIGKNALCNCKCLTSVIIPDSVSSIGSGAFYNCNGLLSLVIPDSVTSIGQDIFGGCTGLTSLTIGSGVTEFPLNRVDTRAIYHTEADILPFAFSMNMQEYLVSPDNPCFTAIDGVLFDKSAATLLSYPPARKAEHYTIPEGVTAIAPNAFLGCLGLDAMTLPDAIAFESSETVPVHPYPLAMTVERMEQFLDAASLSRQERRELSKAYHRVKPGSDTAKLLEAVIPALKDSQLYVLADYVSADKLPEAEQEQLVHLLAVAGYTAADLEIDNALLAFQPHPCVVVSPQLTREALPEKCLLVVKPDSLAFHWAIQNGIHVMFDE